MSVGLWAALAHLPRPTTAAVRSKAELSGLPPATLRSNVRVMDFLLPSCG